MGRVPSDGNLLLAGQWRRFCRSCGSHRVLGICWRVEDEVESGFYVRGSDRVAIVEFYVGLEVEDVGQRVRRLPGCGEVTVEIHLCVAGEQSTEYKAVDPL